MIVYRYKMYTFIEVRLMFKVIIGSLVSIFDALNQFLKEIAMTTRRQFLITVIPASAFAFGAASTAFADPAKLDEKDAIAISLGYSRDASKVNAKKFPAYVAGRHCSGCMLYQGKSTDALAPCGAVGGKLVSGKGWCTAWVKKA
jgi:High potential iron-sulfur protein